MKFAGIACEILNAGMSSSDHGSTDQNQENLEKFRTDSDQDQVHFIGTFYRNLGPDQTRANKNFPLRTVPRVISIFSQFSVLKCLTDP